MYNLSLLIDFNKRPSQRKKAYSDSFNNSVLGFEEKKEIICFIEAIQEEGNKKRWPHKTWIKIIVMVKPKQISEAIFLSSSINQARPTGITNKRDWQTQ